MEGVMKRSSILWFVLLVMVSVGYGETITIESVSDIPQTRPRIAYNMFDQENLVVWDTWFFYHY